MTAVLRIYKKRKAKKYVGWIFVVFDLQTRRLTLIARAAGAERRTACETNRRATKDIIEIKILIAKLSSTKKKKKKFERICGID